MKKVFRNWWNHALIEDLFILSAKSILNEEQH